MCVLRVPQQIYRVRFGFVEVCIESKPELEIISMACSDNYCCLLIIKIIITIIMIEVMLLCLVHCSNSSEIRNKNYSELIR